MSIVHLKSGRTPPPARRIVTETKIFTADEIGAWRVPPFQRPLHVNDKVRALSESIKLDGGVIPGVVTIGIIKDQTAIYIVDGQHRLEAFRISGLPECLTDVRFMRFETIAEMAEEFVNLNSRLVNMRPDDMLRGIEPTMPVLQKLREKCKFVGYGRIRRSEESPILSASLVVRLWAGSMTETPTATGPTAVRVVEAMTTESVNDLIAVLKLCEGAWGRDSQYARLWSSLNLGLCMWLWRRMVRESDRTSNKRWIKLDSRQFSNCLMSLSADSMYLDWLQGRQLTDRDRGPGYKRIKKLFTARLVVDGFKGTVRFPQPPWVTD
jgi:hypothetical protein